MFSVSSNGLKEYDIYLCEPNKDIVGAIKSEDLSFRIKWNNYSEAEFTFHKKYTDMLTGEIKTHPLFDKVEQTRKIFISGVGYFVLQEATLVEDGIDDYKQCSAFSSEYELSQKYIEDFKINCGEIDSIDGVKFYDQEDHSKSLLHLVLEKYPSWSIGTIHPSLANIERTYSVTRKDVYDFLMEEVANTTRCVFVFDTINNMISAYPEDSAGQDTDIYVSLRNLAQRMEVKYNADDIRTVLNVTGADSLSIREVNFGLPYIMNLDYYANENWMGNSYFENPETHEDVPLYVRYNSYKSIITEAKTTYEQLLQELNSLHDAKSELLNKIPIPDPIDWDDPDTSESLSSYGLYFLQEKEAVFMNLKAVQAEAGWGYKSSEHHEDYVKTNNVIKWLRSEDDNINGIKAREQQIKDVENEISSKEDEMQELSSGLAMESYFNEDELNALSYFMKEDEYNDSNFVVIESDTDEDIVNLKKALLESGEKELEKISKPQLEFDSDIENLYAIPAFSKFSDDFQVGNNINVEIRDGYVLKVRLLEIEVDTNSQQRIIVSFGNLSKLKNQSDIHAELLAQATSAGKSVANNSSYWQRGADKATETQKRISQGLIDAATSIKASGGAGQDGEWDTYGLHLRKYQDGLLSPEEGWIINNQFLYSSDNFQTVNSVFGEYEIDGEKYWGLLASAVMAGYIEGSKIVSPDLIGGTIKSLNYNDGSEEGSVPSGTFIDLVNGTFSFGGGKFTYDGDTLYLSALSESVSSLENKINDDISALEIETSNEISEIKNIQNELIEERESLNGFIQITPSEPSLTLGTKTEDGVESKTKIKITDSKIELSDDSATAFLESSRFTSQQGEFSENLFVGEYVWVHRSSNNHLSLKWVGSANV